MLAYFPVVVVALRCMKLNRGRTMRATLMTLTLLSALALAGCAGTITAFKNDPLQSYEVKVPSIYAMTGDRRTAVFARQNSDMKYCAESLPDAVAAVAASSRAAANYKEAGIDIADSTAVGLLQTFQRTEIAEVSRQLGWNTCLAWAQGAITSSQYHQLLEKLVVGSIDVMQKRAGQPVVPLPVGSMLLVAAATPPKLTPTPTPAPSATTPPAPAK